MLQEIVYWLIASFVVAGFGASGSLYPALASVERSAVYSKESQSICFRKHWQKYN
jgi:hypothetical protein